MVTNTPPSPSVVCSASAWEQAILLDPPREQSHLQEQRLTLLIRTALKLHKERPYDTSITFDVSLPMPGEQPPRALSMRLQMMKLPAKHPALLITLGHDSH